MDRKKRTYILSILLVEAAGFIVGMLTRGGTQLYATSINKPPLSPPGILFPIAWTILYALMGIGLARVILARNSPARRTGLVLFAVQLVLNLAWC
ncbi:MAG: TspO/MBR family protein, partial [Coriobacteriales bacterium]|nr:TspO/MBR family protein [Coriobacteriales bacterium]